MIIIQLCPELLNSHFLQHGFKRQESTTHAAYTVRETINHYINTESSLFICTLDAEKAFDKVWWIGLFYKLIDVISYVIWFVLFTYYQLSTFAVLYKDTMSSIQQIFCGVKQGGILSPYLFAFFINDLIILLYESPYGTYIDKTFTGVVAYADDILLLSTMARGLQAMLNIAYNYCRKWHLRLNPNPGKTDIICFNHKVSDQSLFYLGQDTITITTELEHLGFVWNTNDKFLLQSHGNLKIQKFKAACYAFIHRGIQKFHPNTIKKIFFGQLEPLLYGMGLCEFNHSVFSKWSQEIRSIIKTLFNCSKYCSNHLFKVFDIPSLHEIIAKRISINLRLIFNIRYTQDILFFTKRQVNSKFMVHMAMLHYHLNIYDYFYLKRYRYQRYRKGTNGIIDSLQFLLTNWHLSQCRKQFYDFLHMNCNHPT